jgi:hypothetical protein
MECALSIHPWITKNACHLELSVVASASVLLVVLNVVGTAIAPYGRPADLIAANENRAPAC